MRVVIQRVTEASVRVGQEVVGSIGPGFVVLAAILDGDTNDDMLYVVRKMANLRVFEDEQDKMNLSILDTKGSILAISQFTLAGDARHGRRPSFSAAARPEVAEPLFNNFVEELRGLNIPVETGRFQTHMEVELVNDGPVTILLDSKKLF